MFSGSSSCEGFGVGVKVPPGPFFRFAYDWWFAMLLERGRETSTSCIDERVVLRGTVSVQARGGV